MAVNVETISTLERRVTMAVPVDEIERQVDARLKKLARDVKMPGFRPGKVPLKLVAQQHGPQVRSEVLGDAVQSAFSDAVKEAKLRVAGYPKIEKKDGADDKALEFSATFEVYPEIKPGDVSVATIERPQVSVDEARSTRRSRCCASSACATRRLDARGAVRRPCDGGLRRTDRRRAVRRRQGQTASRS